MYLVWLGAVIQIIGSAAYIRDTLRGTTRPNRVTWFFWTLAPFIGTAAALEAGVGWAVLPVFMVGFMPLLVFVASFVNKSSYWQLNHIDYTCGIIAAIALVLWAITKQPIVAIVFSILSDGIAALPTLVKAWTHPQTETALAYGATLFAAPMGLLAVRSWSFSEYGFLAYLILMNGLILVAIYRKQLWALLPRFR